MAQQNTAADLPVTKVVLYTNGVAYFEHSGVVSGSQEFSLPVDSGDMDDLLQSLVLLDHGGGTIRPVRYAAENPLDRTLASYSLDLSGNPALAELLLQARGERVSIGGSQTVDGVIVSVERVQEPEAADRHLLLLATDQGLQRIALEEVRSIDFENEQLREELDAALLAVARNRDTDQKDVRLQFDGEGERSVQVGYVREMPVWKTSYRLVIGDDGNAELQGWAIFDNPTSLDLENVQVTFVAGQPVSFITQLYEAVYVQRQRVGPPVAQQAAPPPVFAAEMAMPAPAAAGSARSFEGEALVSLADMGVEVMASGVQTGVTFQYVVEEPVTVGRFESAMIPIVQQEVPAQRLSILAPGRADGHPLRGVRLRNDTGLHLAAGTVTVFDGGAFTGTARFGDVLPDEDVLLAYATDLAVTSSSYGASDPEQVLSLRIMDGTLVSEVRLRYRTSYDFQAGLDENRLVLVEHPANSGFELVSPVDPAPLRSGSNYRFGVLLAADSEAGDHTATSDVPLQVRCTDGAECQLVVIEERVASRRVALSNMTTDSIVVVLQNELLDEASALLLERLLESGRQIDEIERQLRALATQRGQIFEEQERIRANMAELDQSSSLYQRYTAQLNDQEDELERIATERIQLEERLQELEAGRAELLRNS